MMLADPRPTPLLLCGSVILRMTVFHPHLVVTVSGIHFRTALIAYNKPGYITASRERSSSHITGPPDHIIPACAYYYHLGIQGPDPLYPICREFTFPHDTVPQKWAANAPPVNIYLCNWTALSQSVENRDVKCRVSGGRGSLTTAQDR
jgi:hypothetical protein